MLGCSARVEPEKSCSDWATTWGEQSASERENERDLYVGGGVRARLLPLAAVLFTSFGSRTRRQRNDRALSLTGVAHGSGGSPGATRVWRAICLTGWAGVAGPDVSEGRWQRVGGFARWLLGGDIKIS